MQQDQVLPHHDLQPDPQVVDENDNLEEQELLQIEFGERINIGEVDVQMYQVDIGKYITTLINDKINIHKVSRLRKHSSVCN